MYLLRGTKRRRARLRELRNKAEIYLSLHRQAALTLEAALAVLDRLDAVADQQNVSELDQLCFQEAERTMEDLSELEGHEVVVTIKMDGEQTTIYSDGYCHARSIDSGGHPSRDWVRALAGRVGPQLPSGWRICGENLWAKHSIHYKNLPDYFLMFSIWNGLTCLSWQETVEWAAMLDLHIVQRLPRSWDQLRELGPWLAEQGNEGYVVRRADSFHYRDFRKKVGKYVRASHVHTHGHWMREQIVRNEVAK